MSSIWLNTASPSSARITSPRTLPRKRTVARSWSGSDRLMTSSRKATGDERRHLVSVYLNRDSPNARESTSQRTPMTPDEALARIREYDAGLRAFVRVFDPTLGDGSGPVFAIKDL